MQILYIKKQKTNNIVCLPSADSPDVPLMKNICGPVNAGVVEVEFAEVVDVDIVVIDVVVLDLVVLDVVVLDDVVLDNVVVHPVELKVLHLRWMHIYANGKQKAEIIPIKIKSNLILMQF